MYPRPGVESENDGAIARRGEWWWDVLAAACWVAVCGVACGVWPSLSLEAEEAKSAAQVVVVKSVPSDLEFDLVGPKNLTVRHGRTPVTLEGLEPGKYRVIFRQAGSMGQRYSFTLGPEGAGVTAEVTGDFTVQDEVKKLQLELSEQQASLEKGAILMQKVGPQLGRELAVSSLKNAPLRSLLAKHGFKVTVPGGAADGGPGVAATPAPLAKESVGNAAPKVAPVTVPPAVKDSEAAPGPGVGQGTSPAPAANGSSPATATATAQWAQPTAVAEPKLPVELASVEWDADKEKEWANVSEGLRKLITSRKTIVAQSKEFEKIFQLIAADLLELARTNEEAARIVQKWGIKRQ